MVDEGIVPEGSCLILWAFWFFEEDGAIKISI
jgi:hypothetical protein